MDTQQLENLEASLIMMGFKNHVSHPGWQTQDPIMYINKDEFAYVEIYLHANFLRIKPVLSMTPVDGNTMSIPLGKNTIKDVALYMHKQREQNNDTGTVQGYFDINGILQKA